VTRAALARPRGKSGAGARDTATRRRLLDAATRLFAERGFRRVTVREICDAARANVAAVNYHFGDKDRLYREVVEAALDMVRGFADQAMAAPAGATAAERLAHYVFSHLAREQSSIAARRSALLRELFRHELTEPTAMGEYIVEQALKPRLRHLAAVVAELSGPGADPETVNRCVLSIQAQCLFPIAAPAALTGLAPRTHADRQRLARHVFEFSLAGIHALAAQAGSDFSLSPRVSRVGSADRRGLGGARPRRRTTGTEGRSRE
jgi:AcrR family transcriptional regulator